MKSFKYMLSFSPMKRIINFLWPKSEYCLTLAKKAMMTLISGHKISCEEKLHRRFLWPDIKVIIVRIIIKA